jgi:hypothetical protein
MPVTTVLRRKESSKCIVNRPFVVLLWFCCLASTGSAFVSEDVVSDSLFEAFQGQIPKSTQAANRFIDSLLLVGRTTDNCILSQVASAFLVKNTSPSASEMSSIVQGQTCPVHGYHVQYNFGVRYFLLKKYKESKR